MKHILPGLLLFACVTANAEFTRLSLEGNIEFFGGINSYEDLGLTVEDGDPFSFEFVYSSVSRQSMWDI